jgi:hypothetical protein
MHWSPPTQAPPHCGYAELPHGVTSSGKHAQSNVPNSLMALQCDPDGHVPSHVCSSFFCFRQRVVLPSRKLIYRSIGKNQSLLKLGDRLS